MKVTSHFIGVTLDNRLFVDLFVDLQTYLTDNNIADSVSFHNPLSTHITVYYLDKNLARSDQEKITKDLKKINKRFLNTVVKVDRVDFFRKNDKESLCFLSPSNINELVELNHFFKSNYPNKVSNNDFLFMPHISIFNIKNHSTFATHKAAFLAIINKNLKTIEEDNALRSINLYYVNSTFHPEIQIIDHLVLG